MSCETCERCTWNPGPDCATGHPHCAACGHCFYRHTSQNNVTVVVGSTVFTESDLRVLRVQQEQHRHEMNEVADALGRTFADLDITGNDA